MVDPIVIFIIALATAFLLGLLERLSKSLTTYLFYTALLVMTAISGEWLFRIIMGGSGEMVYTAGFKPPFSINLFMGRMESFLTFFINLVGFFAALFLYRKFYTHKY
ncbi:MAG: hypothetical protein KGY75_05995, partial [Candidatus Cloacimonetes bacterium]|nr:hypothetical protein [Candidatus Cloacimonadota bacterium]